MDELLPILKWGVGAVALVGGGTWTLHRAFNSKADKGAVVRLSDKIDENTRETAGVALSVARLDGRVGTLEMLIKGIDKKLDKALE